MSSPPIPCSLNHTALLLPGGGARAAYQVGVLKALAELTRDYPQNPFPILCGTSAGALNAVALATQADNFAKAVERLESLWMRLAVDHVYRTDWFDIANNAWRLLRSLFNAGIAVGRPVGLLDNTPLRELLGKVLNFDHIGDHLQQGHLRAVSVTAMNYTQGVSMSFFQGGPDHTNWQRWRRQGVACPLSLKHLMASTAIPTIFPPEEIWGNYYGDGALRQLTPISPALHLGAERVLIVPPNGHKRNYAKPIRKIQSPAFGQILGHLLNSAFIDSLETDIELLERVNELVTLLPAEQRTQLSRKLNPVEFYVLSPSQDIDTIAELHVKELPRSIRYFLRITGSGNYSGGVNAASYLLFTRPFVQQLIELGYGDVMAEASEVVSFLARAPEYSAAVNN
ncbi:MAG TPA: patatin-like phospholipase family protein [Spongiibacteraceae bacterium]